MAGIPLFTLVDDATHEEIRLVDHNDEPCAIPMQQGFRDEDERYSYGDGSEGRSPRVLRHEVSLACDFLPDAIRRRLVRLMADRSKFHFTPGWGENTAMAWRPVHVDGTTLPSGDTWYDLTGQVALTNTGGADQMVWDDWTTQKGRMIEPDSGDTAPALVVETPYGAGQALQGANTNRWTPDYPESATPGFGTGTAGWEKFGIGLGHITFTHVSDGFGVTACPDSLRVTVTNDVSASRGMIADALWNSADGDYEGFSFSGSRLLCTSFWIKGRFPAGNTVKFYKVAHSGGAATELDSVDLDEVYDGWTKINLHGYDADWSLYYPRVYIDLSSTNGEAADFQVAAMSISFGNNYLQSARWSEYGTTTTSETVLSGSIEKPQSGSATVSLYVPQGVEAASNWVSWLFALGGSAVAGTLRWRESGGSPSVQFMANSSYSINYQKELTPGIHAVTVSWGTSYIALHLDGETVYEDSTATDKDFTFLSDGVVGLGYSSYSPWPLIPLTFRLDADQHRDDVQHIHAALTDSVALGTITAARGRLYEITQLPNTPRMVDGATYWIGTLGLRQIDYLSDFEDVTTKEK